MRALWFAAVSGLLFGDAFAAAVPFWGACESLPADTPITPQTAGPSLDVINADQPES